jgi:hypothetical protein
MTSDPAGIPSRRSLKDSPLDTAQNPGARWKTVDASLISMNPVLESTAFFPIGLGAEVLRAPNYAVTLDKPRATQPNAILEISLICVRMTIIEY